MKLVRIGDVRLKGNGRFAFYVIVTLLGLLASAHLWGPGMVNTRGGGDSPFLLQRTLDMAENLRHGIFPPRWMAHAAYDLGYPFFNHYASLPYYLSGGLTALGINPLVAIQTTQTLGFVLAALTMALWTQSIYQASGIHGRIVILLAVVAYTFAPFHLVNVYVRGDSLSEFYAQVWYPLILWALGRLVASAPLVAPVASGTDSQLRKRSVGRHVIVAALAYAALILTHNVSAMIFSPFAALYVLLLDIKFVRPVLSDVWNQINSGIVNCLKAVILHGGVLLSPFVLGILLTTWFWLPAVAETGYGQMGQAFTAGYFHYSKHFRGINLIQPSFLFDYNVAVRAEDAGPFTMGLCQAVATVLGTVALIGLLVQAWKRQRRGVDVTERSLRVSSPGHGLFLLLGLFISTLMITPLSRPLWDHLPLLEITQFPWRFLSVQALFTSAVVAALGIYPWQRSNLHLSLFPAICVVGVLIASTMLSLHPDRLLITDEDVTWDKLLLYESFTGNIGTTIRYEYLPQDVVPRLYISESVVDGKLPQPIALGAGVDSPGVLSAELLRRTPVKQVWQVVLAHDASVVFPLNWWPGWRAIVDGQRLETRPVTGSGRLTLDLAAGTHTVILRLRDTPLRLVAEVISALTLLGCLIVPLGLAKIRGNDFSRQFYLVMASELGAGVLTTAGVLLISLLLCLVFSFISLRDSPKTRAYAFDFLQMPYPHAGSLDFLASASDLDSAGGEIIKLWFEPLFIQAEPGEIVRIPLQGGRRYTSVPLTATVRLVSLAAPRHGVSYGLSEKSFDLGCVSSPSAEGLTTSVALGRGSDRCPALALSMPSDLARGLYLVELRVYGDTESGLREYFAHTSQGHAMGPVYIGAIRVPNGPARSADLSIKTVLGKPDNNSGLVLHTVEVDQIDPAMLRLKMAWSTYIPMARNWSLSLRLLDATGRLIAQQDLQPGYGYLPTTLWKPGELVIDYPELSLPEGLAPGAYILRIVAYLRATMEGGGEVDAFVMLPKATLRDPQDVYCGSASGLDSASACVDRDSKSLCKANGISLVNVDLPTKIDEGGPLDCYVEWYAEAEPPANLSARWEVVDAHGKTVAVTAGPLSPGSQTTSWPLHAWVRAPLHIDLPHTLPGLSDASGRNLSYQLQVTLLSQGEQGGAQKPMATCSLAAALPIAARARRFDTPSPMYGQIAVFRGRIDDVSILRLLGYDWAHQQQARLVDDQYEIGAGASALSLTLWWQAAVDPGGDYKRFVHLFNPETEQVLAQDDAMPRSWTYPTSWWVAGEVVSETVTLDLNAVPPGTYRLAVGWYDPEAVGEGFESARLPTLDANGNPLAMNRAVLSTLVIRK